MIYTILLKSLYAALCTLGFSIIFNIPRKLIPFTAMCGAIGWFSFEVSSTLLSSVIIANAIAALVIGFIGEFLSIYKKHPSSLFIIPSIIPLVPGYGLYYTMLFIVQNNYTNAVEKGAETIFVAIAIACGLMISNTIFRQIRLTRIRRKIVLKK